MGLRNHGSDKSKKGQGGRLSFVLVGLSGSNEVQEGLMSSHKILRLPSVQELTGKSRSGIYSDVARGVFPSPVRLGRRAVGWKSQDIEDWLEAREPTAGANR
jgi:prophage regulatory protein